MDSTRSKRRSSDKTAFENDRDADASTERWLISYADLITTLMVFFLALYVLQLARNKELENRTFDQHVNAKATANATSSASGIGTTAGGLATGRKALLASLETLRDRQQITFVNVSQGVEIAINAKVLFNSGDARLLPESFDVLNQVAEILKTQSTKNIVVEGHTDSLPISNTKYESNWELSSARAGAVVRFFVDRGIEPHRLAAVGRADNVPVVVGDDARARAANRRVTVLVEY
jgi:chemotaxis protein MotB